MKTPPDSVTTEAVKPVDTRTADIRIAVSGTKAKGFTFAKGATVLGVGMAHAEYLQGRGESVITNVH